MDVKLEKPTDASVASPAPDADADRHAVDHGGGGGDDSGSDVSTVPPSPGTLIYRESFTMIHQQTESI